MRKKMNGNVTQSFAGLKADSQSQEHFLKRQFYRKILFSNNTANKVIYIFYIRPFDKFTLRERTFCK